MHKYLKYPRSTDVTYSTVANSHLVAESSFPITDHAKTISITEYTEEDLASIKPLWDDLFQACDSKSGFCTWEWTYYWWKYFHSSFPEGQAHLIIIGVWHKDVLVALAPFTLPAKRSNRMIRLRPLGDVGLNEGMTEEIAVLFRMGYEELAEEALVQYLSNPPLKTRWDCATLRTTSRSKNDLVCPVSTDRQLLIGIPRLVHLPTSWEAYYAKLSRSMKTNLTYYPRKLKKNGYTWTLRLATDIVDVEDSIKHVIRLHRERAQSQRGVSHVDHIPGDVHASFLTELICAFASKDEAWVATILIDGQVVAAQAFLLFEGVLTFYYSGYATEFYDYSPLLILAGEVIKESIRRGVHTINFLPDYVRMDGKPHCPAEWKSRWGAQSAGIDQERMLYPQHLRATFMKGYSSIRLAARKYLHNYQVRSQSVKRPSS